MTKHALTLAMDENYALALYRLEFFQRAAEHIKLIVKNVC